MTVTIKHSDRLVFIHVPIIRTFELLYIIKVNILMTIQLEIFFFCEKFYYFNK